MKQPRAGCDRAVLATSSLLPVCRLLFGTAMRTLVGSISATYRIYRHHPSLPVSSLKPRIAKTSVVVVLGLSVYCRLAYEGGLIFLLYSEAPVVVLAE